MRGNEAELPSAARRDRTARDRATTGGRSAGTGTRDDDPPGTVDTAHPGGAAVEPILQMLMHGFNMV
jgi:hypothetical protein